MKIFNRNNIFILLFLVFIFSCSKKTKNEGRENESFDTAEVVLNVVNGQIDDSSDKDYYFFEANVLSMIGLKLESETNTQLSMTIFDYNQNIIKHVSDSFTNDSSGNYNRFIRDIYLEESLSEELKYYILIEGAEKTKYTLIIEEKEYSDEYENEPNDSFASAQVFDFDYNIRHYNINSYYSQVDNTNVNIKGFVNKEVDIYKLTNSIKLPLIASLGLSSVPSSDASISIYNEDYNKLLTIDSNIQGDGEKVEKLLLNPHSSYYILVHGSDKNNNIPYKLLVSVEDIYDDTELEPNNIPAMSQNIVYDIRYKGAIDYILDTDHFMFSVPKETTINISYFKIDFENINIDIFDANGNKIGALTKVDGSEDILFSEGTYYLVFSFDKVEKGDFKKLNYEFMLSPLDITEFEFIID